MISSLAAAAVVALYAWIIYRCAPKPGERNHNLLERYRPHAPAADWSIPPDHYDRLRQYADLRALPANGEQSSPD
ncbi:hypothetical protein [Nocardia aurantia]|uniref:Uncharacterized protein n=1 Tax=Nocardia aurantia TaxID=2585199 RepID=A0A7K0DYY8_9NOCA|nr:hypothetical protein [Nocardia aurantia]MQY31030.1 hypothetical protein [Nocardia aurantia]